MKPSVFGFPVVVHPKDPDTAWSLDLGVTGERLVFGSTTGSVWVSEDSGDTWLTLAEHLPPVHAVIFA